MIKKLIGRFKKAKPEVSTEVSVEPADAFAETPASSIETPEATVSSTDPNRPIVEFTQLETPQEATNSELPQPAPEQHESALGKVDKALLAVSILVLLVSVTMLFTDSWFNTFDDSNLTKIGSVDHSWKDVRRKVKDGLAWVPIDSSTLVYEGDSIFTGDGSNVEVKLADGGVLKVGEKSLVVVRTRGGALELDLKYGNIVGEIKSDKPVILVNNGERTELKAGEEIRVKKDQETLSRKVEILSAKAPVEKEGPKFAISAVSPSADARIWKKESEGLKFTWKSKKTLENPRIEFSIEPNFKTVIGEAEGNEGVAEVAKLPVTDGSFYWRIKDESTQSLSIPRKVFVYADRAPIHVNPESGHEFIIDDPAGEQAVTFSWDDEAGSKEFDLQIAKSDKFDEIVFETKTSKQRIQSKPLPTGAYFWRVAGLHPARKNSPWSEAWPFRIHSFGKLAPPELETPMAEYEIPAAAIKKAADAKVKGPIPVSEAQSPKLRWKPVPNVKTYVLEVAADKEFSKTTKVKTDKLAFQLDKVAPKVIHWRVRSVDANGKQSEPSRNGELAILMPAPQLQPLKPVVQKFKDKKEADKAKAAAELKWNALPYAASYEIEAAKDPAFKNAKKMTQKEANKKIALPAPGNFFFRVRALGDKGQAISTYSAAQPFEYKRELEIIKPTPTPAPVPEPPRNVAAIPPVASAEPELGVSNVPPPQLRDPNNNTSVMAFGKSPVFLNFRWRPVNGARHYRVEISDTPEFTQKLAEYKTGETNYFFEKNLPAGTLYWRVRAEFTTEATVWSRPNTFTVSYK